MVKNLKLKNKIFRSAFLILCCIPILMSFLLPASAAGIYRDDGTQTRYDSLMNGAVELNLQYNSNRYDYIVSTDLPDIIPEMKSGDVYVLTLATQYYDFAVLTGGVEETVQLVTRANKVDSYLSKEDYNFTRVRIEYQLRANSNIPAYTNGVTYNLEPFGFDWDADFLHNMVRIYSFGLSNISVSGTLWYLNPANKLASYDFNLKLDGVGKANDYFTQSVFTKNFCTHFVKTLGLSEGDPVLFTDLKVNCDLASSSAGINSTAIEVLTENYKVGVPHYRRDSVSWFENKVKTIMNSLGDKPNAETTASVFTSWLASTISSFFDFEIMPGFAFGDVFGMIISIICSVYLIKFFAGG